MKWTGMTQCTGVQPGKRYMLSGWIRTEDVHREARQYQNCGLLAQFLDKNGNIVKVGNYSAVGTIAEFGTGDWRQVQKVIRVPEGAVAAKVGCNLSMSGTAWFDDVAFAPLAEGDWRTLKTRRFIYHWEGDEKPPGEAITKNEKGLEELESLLGVNSRGPFTTTSTPPGSGLERSPGIRGMPMWKTGTRSTASGGSSGTKPSIC